MVPIQYIPKIPMALTWTGVKKFWARLACVGWIQIGRKFVSSEQAKHFIVSGFVKYHPKSSRLNLPVMSGRFVVIADAAGAHTCWTAWRENTCAQHKRVLLTFRIQSIATCHRLELYEFSFLGRFGQWGLLRKKIQTVISKYATFEASFLCFHGEK